MAEPYELPDGWRWRRLGDLLSFVGSGSTPKGGQKAYDRDTGIPFLRSQNVYPEGLRLDDVAYISEEIHTEMRRTQLRPLDVLLNITGASIGRSAVVPASFDEGNVNQHVCILRATGEVDPFFLSEFLNSPAGQDQIMAAQAGVTRQGLNYTQLRALQIALPSLEEQLRIRSRIDELRSQSRTVHQALNRGHALLKHFRQAVLAAAFRGELTGRDPNDEAVQVLLARQNSARQPQPVDSRSLPQLPAGWAWAQFGDLLAELKNGYFSKTPALEPPGTPILRISAVRPMSVSFDDPRYLRGIEAEALSRYRLDNCDLLFTRYSGSLDLVGVCGMVRNVPPDTIYPDKLIRARAYTSLVLPEYLELYFATRIPRYVIEARAKSSAGQQGVSGKDLKAVPVALAPHKEQNSIVAKVHALFACADRIERAAEAAQVRAGNVDQAILARAFRGEL